MKSSRTPKTYTGAKTREISFPLGGVGTGCIGLAGNGRLVDWEIQNHPNKGSTNGFSHFAVKAERAGRLVDARILAGDLQPPYSGVLQRQGYSGFGFGVDRETLAGAPHFCEWAFMGEFPLARLEFRHPSFPGLASLSAFNPFIPLDDRQSSMPAAFFEIELTNTTAETLDYTVAATLSNPLPAANLHEMGEASLDLELDGREDVRQESVVLQAPAGRQAHWVHLSSDSLAPENIRYGTLTLATDADHANSQAYWFRGEWFDSLEVFWRDFTAPGPIQPRSYTPDKAGERNAATLAARLTLKPAETGRVRFILAWFFPNVENDWNEDERRLAEKKGIPNAWRNYYASLFQDSLDVALEGLRTWDVLYQCTGAFKEALFGSDLPEVVLEAISANLSVLKSPTVMRLEDGAFYGFEGCHCQSGCCEGSCTHVWNYNQALPFLFPALERSMRELDFANNLRPDGMMRFRLALPLGLREMEFVPRPCADGQFGNILKVYRDWKISGDGEWLRQLWPSVRLALEYAWLPENPDRWDPYKQGVLTGRQHHTLDMELFGPNAWLTGFYLAALKACVEMAEAIGEPEFAAECQEIFAKGKRWTDANLFNGEYYTQDIDLTNRAILANFMNPDSSRATVNYWDAEHAEIKYQLGDGCLIDQVLAQWHADLYGLGDIFDPAQTRTALESLFRNNFKEPLADYFNPCRIFALNDEAGLVMCTWPEGRRRPVIPVPYSQEVMTGFEYAAAGLMIAHGLVDEGLRVVQAVRDRYDGERRNPWNEIECGSNYARTLASYALLNIFSGFQFDLDAGWVGFNPLRRTPEGGFRCFWSLDSGWGVFATSPSGTTLEVQAGRLPLAALRLPFLQAAPTRATLGKVQLPFTFDSGAIHFDPHIMIEPGKPLNIVF
jgi:non-lysosomal glucosylceramidase